MKNKISIKKESWDIEIYFAVFPFEGYDSTKKYLVDCCANESE